MNSPIKRMNYSLFCKHYSSPAGSIQPARMGVVCAVEVGAAAGRENGNGEALPFLRPLPSCVGSGKGVKRLRSEWSERSAFFEFLFRANLFYLTKICLN